MTLLTKNFTYICNLDEPVNNVHFFGRCPVLSLLRLLSFQKPILSEREIIEILDGNMFLGSLLPNYVFKKT